MFRGRNLLLPGCSFLPDRIDCAERISNSGGFRQHLIRFGGMAIVAKEPIAGRLLFPSERNTAMSKDNLWLRNMLPKSEKVGPG